MTSETPSSQAETTVVATRAAPRRKHLMDPDAPREIRNVAAAKKKLTHVQQWVMSVLVVTTVIHLQGGLVLASVYLKNPAPGAEIGLNVIVAVLGVLGLAGAFAIHRRNVLTPWLLLGTIPGLIGIYLVQR